MFARRPRLTGWKSGSSDWLISAVEVGSTLYADRRPPAGQTAFYTRSTKVVYSTALSISRSSAHHPVDRRVLCAHRPKTMIFALEAETGNTRDRVPTTNATYCFPPTEYVIRPPPGAPGRSARQRIFPVAASNA